MNKLRTVAVLAALGLMSLAGACGPALEPGDDAAESVAGERLDVVEVDEAAGKLVVKFEKDGRTITYDMRLGPKMEIPPSAEELAANPELPSYQVDAQVRDANGQIFQMRMGGDSFIDSSWAMPHVEGFDEAGRVKDIQLMRAAVPAFRKLKVPESLDQLRLTGIDIGLGVEEVPEKPGLTNAAPADPTTIEGTLSPQVNVVSGGSSVVKWDYRIRNKSLAGGLGNHTGVNLRGWTASSIVFNADSCNHGSCASSGDMGTHCTMSGFRTDDGTHTRFFYSETSTSTGSSNGGCTTHYDWDSTSVNGGGHNCNDDAELQANAIYHDSAQSTTGGSCSALGFHNWSPGCH
ncbi:hypothetical protein SOCE26_059070 [Sorangium cellulosum]|uniref:Secreted protein n=1 Tax=Sorangium cellulosum TaxID=56 RepID=A0A2L0EYS5_SORCE|nr:hypothetical protein [Sorangium cellulosum]AUX44443.1 hypothetical protein SOCE26_059070 [Sorangium cellulosum]